LFNLIYFIFITLFPAPFSEPNFKRLIHYTSTDRFVLQCFDTVWLRSIKTVKIVPKWPFVCRVGR